MFCCMKDLFCNVMQADISFHYYMKTGNGTGKTGNHENRIKFCFFL